MSLENLHNVLYKPLLQAADMSVNSVTVDTAIQGITCYAIQANWSGFAGDATARITTSGGNDSVNFTQVDSIIPTGTSGSYLLNVEKAGYRFIRLQYTQTGAPVGTLSASISGKVI